MSSITKKERNRIISERLKMFHKKDLDNYKAGEEIEEVESYKNNLATILIHSLSPYPDLKNKLHDIESVGRLASLLHEIVDKKIITDTEASILMEFIASKFIERKFDDVISNIFKPKSNKRFKSFRLRRMTYGEE